MVLQEAFLSSSNDNLVECRKGNCSKMDVLAHTSKNTAPNRYPAVFAAIKHALHWEGQAKRILSIGCGQGDEVWTLRGLFPESTVHGYDLDVEAIQEAQQSNEEYPYVDFFCRKADLWDDYDLVMCLSVACRYPNSKQFKYSQFCRLMKDIDKCTAPGGFIALYNAQYDFCSCEELANSYIPIDIGRNDSGTVPKFTPNGQPLGREFWVPILFKKSPCSSTALPVVNMEVLPVLPWQPLPIEAEQDSPEIEQKELGIKEEHVSQETNEDAEVLENKQEQEVTDRGQEQEAVDKGQQQGVADNEQEAAEKPKRKKATRKKN